MTPIPGPQERAELIVVREALEGVLSPTLATTLLFEALERWGAAPPETLEQVRAFAMGALDTAVRRRMLVDEADDIRERLERLFAHAPKAASRDDEPTLKIPIKEIGATQEMLVAPQRVPVVLLASGTELADRLSSSLGRDRVAVFPVSTAETFTKALSVVEAPIVLIDATHAPLLDAYTARIALRALRAGTTLVIWGSETLFGQQLAVMLEGGGPTPVELMTREGTSPLFDLVLSRRTGD